MVILELIRASNPDSRRGVFIRLKTNALRGSLVNHNNLTNRMALRRRWFIQISALSTFDGKIVAYPSRTGRQLMADSIAPTEFPEVLSTGETIGHKAA